MEQRSETPEVISDDLVSDHAVEVRNQDVVSQEMTDDASLAPSQPIDPPSEMDAPNENQVHASQGSVSEASNLLTSLVSPESEVADALSETSLIAESSGVDHGQTQVDTEADATATEDTVVPGEAGLPVEAEQAQVELLISMGFTRELAWESVSSLTLENLTQCATVAKL